MGKEMKVQRVTFTADISSFDIFAHSEDEARDIMLDELNNRMSAYLTPVIVDARPSINKVAIPLKSVQK